MGTPIRRIRSGCARAASGHAATPLPRSAMNSRRLIGLTPRPRITDKSSIAGQGRASQQKRPAHVRSGSFASLRYTRAARGMSVMPPIATKLVPRNDDR
jgi:hypothetical protein